MIIIESRRKKFQPRGMAEIRNVVTVPRRNPVPLLSQSETRNF